MTLWALRSIKIVVKLFITTSKTFLKFEILTVYFNELCQFIRFPLRDELLSRVKVNEMRTFARFHIRYFFIRFELELQQITNTHDPLGYFSRSSSFLPSLSIQLRFGFTREVEWKIDVLFLDGQMFLVLNSPQTFLCVNDKTDRRSTPSDKSFIFLN